MAKKKFEPIQPGLEPEKKPKKKHTIRNIIIGVVAVLVAIMFFGGSGGDSSDGQDSGGAQQGTSQNGPGAAGENHEVSEEDIKSQIEVNAVPTLDGHMCVFITNKSQTVINELDVQVNYKDAEQNVVDLYTDGHDMILPGYTVVSRMDRPDTYDSFDVEMDIDLDVNKSYENHSEQCDVNANKGENGIIVEITNNSDVSIDEIEYVLVFYNGDDVASVGYENDVYDVEAGKTVTEKEYEPLDVEYDRFEVYLNQAHTFGI